MVKSDQEEAKSCKSAEEPSQEWEATSGRKEDLFGEKGKHKWVEWDGMISISDSKDLKKNR